MKQSNGAGRLARLALIAYLMGAAGWAVAAAEPIRIIVAGIGKQIYLPAPLAQSLDFFNAQGLDVTLLSDSSGVNAEDELLAGAAQGVVGFYDHTVALQAKGKFVQCVVQFSRAPGEALLVSTRTGASIRSPADFRAHAIGITGHGSSTDLLTRYLASLHGVRSGEMRLVVAGSGPDFLRAMAEGRIDAGMSTEPTVSKLLRSGQATLLADLRTRDSTVKVLGGDYPGACLYMSSQWVSTHRAQVQALVNAIVKALRFIDTHTAAEIAERLPADYLMGDKALYIDALEKSKSMFLPDGRMPTEGPANVLKILRAVSHGVQNKPVDLSRTFTDDFAAQAR